jgi:hypothetical protein
VIELENMSLWTKIPLLALSIGSNMPKKSMTEFEEIQTAVLTKRGFRQEDLLGYVINNINMDTDVTFGDYVVKSGVVIAISCKKVIKERDIVMLWNADDRVLSLKHWNRENDGSLPVLDSDNNVDILAKGVYVIGSLIWAQGLEHKNLL